MTARETYVSLDIVVVRFLDMIQLYNDAHVEKRSARNYTRERVGHYCTTPVASLGCENGQNDTRKRAPNLATNQRNTDWRCGRVARWTIQWINNPETFAQAMVPLAGALARGGG